MSELDSPPWDREPDQTIPVLRDEEDAPDFRPLRAKAVARAKGTDDDAKLVRELIAMIHYLDCELEAIRDHMDERGPPCEDDDDPAWLAIALGRQPAL